MPEALLNELAILEDVHEVVGADLRKVVGNHNSRQVLAPALDRLEDENARGRVQRGRRLICKAPR